jgi:1-acyl-sn-glycerol-3-phosphate acyltransferase
LVIGSIIPSIFVAKKEVASWFFLGRLVKLAGTVFVNRESKTASVKALDEIRKRLRNGINVVVFPEGTTNDGIDIKDFKSTFFQVPIEMKVPILPVSLLYSHIDGAPVTSETKDKIVWYADMRFLSHVWHLIGIRRIDVKVHLAPPICNAAQERKMLSSIACELVKTGHAFLRLEAGI